MPNYYNPYNFYPASYMAPGYANMNPGFAQASAPVPPTPQQGPKMMEWVEGEVGAKAFQMPNGWPANSPIPLWDSTDTVIYLKSWGPMGIPNPMQKLRYEMPEQQGQQMLTNGVSGAGEPNHTDMSQYATKQDFDELRKDMREMREMMSTSKTSGNNQNGNNSAQSRGGNR